MIINLIMYLRLAVFEIHSLPMRKSDLAICWKIKYLAPKKLPVIWQVAYFVLDKWMCQIRSAESPAAVLTEKPQENHLTGYPGPCGSPTLPSLHWEVYGCMVWSPDGERYYLISYRPANTERKARTWLPKFSWMINQFSFKGTKELSLSHVLFGKQSAKLVSSTY